MPITLNHSNIGVQYSTGSNYIIETVKSDLYRRNEIYDSIIRDNLQTAPVTPSIYIENGTNNVYAVESYTYSGSANTADFTRVFPKSTTCDILIVGGGGGGGFAGSNARGGGGGGAGQFLLKSNYSLNAGKYNINVGRGGVGGNVTTENGETGKNSSITTESNTILLESSGGGGGARGKSGTISNGLNGASGGGGCGDDVANRCLGGTALIQFVNNNIVYTGYNGANGGLAFNGGGGGGYTSAGFSATTISGGDGGSGITNNITGVVINYCAGGGGGGYNNGVSTGTRGGNGGNITAGNGGNYPGANGGNATNGSGSGGGGAGVSVVGGPAYLGGNGGSGIVIIRYLLGTIPANNLLANANEPTITSPTFTETIRTFTHSGGTEDQTSYNITIGQNTICDILIVGGGGGGGGGHGGGGGAGQLILMHQAILSGTYTIKVGKGGVRGTNPASGGIEPTKGSNSSFDTVIAEGGGANGGTLLKDGGSGAGGDSWLNGLGTIQKGLKNTSIDTYSSGTIYSKGNDGGTGGTDPGQGAGGGGAGTSGGDGKNWYTNGGPGNGGDGLSGISELGYDFKTNFGNYGKLESDGNYWFAGGGGGGGWDVAITAVGGKGGGGNGGTGVSGGVVNGSNAVSNTGSGGGGGSGNWGEGGNGGSGIVIIKFKSITSAGILDGITHKRLNFNYINSNDNLIFYYRIDESPFSWLEAYNEAIINGRRLPTITELRTYMTNYPSIVAPFNGLDIWSAVVNPAVANSKDWVQVGNNPHTRGKSHTQDLGVYPGWGDNTTETFARVYWDVVDLNQLRYDFTPYNTEATWKSYAATIPNFTYSLDAFLIAPYDPDAVWAGNYVVGWVQMTLPSTHNFLTITYGLGVQGVEDVRLLINGVLKSSATPSNRTVTYSQAYNVGDVVRIEETFSTMNANFIFQFTNIYPYQHTLNFPVPTIADINNNSNIVLRGAYDLSLSTSNALIIPKAGQYIPQPTTFTNYSVERMYPPVRNFSAATTTVSGQTYGNGTYVVSFSTSFDANLAPYTCFNTSQGSGGHWTAGYTAGNYNGSAFVVAGYLGDWLKIQLPVAIKLTRFEFLMRTDTQGIRERSPKNFKIYGSNDNITWVELVNKTDAVYDTSFRYIQLTQDITTAYTYYGLVVNKLLGSTADTLNFNEWYIYGQEVLPSSLSIRYNLLNPTQDPIGAQWTYNTSNMNVYHMGSVGIGTTSPEYHLDVSGSLNAKTLMYNGSSVNSLGLSVGMIAQVQHLTYTKMEVKDNTGWDAINEDLTSGFVIKITPKSSLSKMLVNLIVFIGMSTSVDNAWWGIKLYRKIGTGSWTEITGCNGTETGSAAATAGTPVWISNNTGMVTYNSSITNASGTYLDSPNTTATVYYTAYWNQRLGDNPSTTGQMFLNRASSQDDAYRPAPSSSWTVEEIWYG